MAIVDELLQLLREEAEKNAQHKLIVENWSRDPSSLWNSLVDAVGERRAAQIAICLLGDALTCGAIKSLYYEKESDDPIYLETDKKGMYDEDSIFVGKDVCLSVES